MSLTIALALATATAPNAKPHAHAAPSAATAKKAPPVDPAKAMEMMTKMFDVLFPAGPEPDPVRLAAARGTALTMFPDGAYTTAMTTFLDKTANRVLDMSEADIANLFPDMDKAAAKKGAAPKKPPSTEPLRTKLMRDDPQFDAKYAAVKAFLTTTLAKVGKVAEPKFREGIARAMARKFDAQQLAEIDHFLATPTGNAYGREMLGIWFEPDVLRGTMQLLPDMMKMAPELAGDAAALDAQFKAMKKDEKPAAKPDAH